MGFGGLGGCVLRFRGLRRPAVLFSASDFLCCLAMAEGHIHILKEAQLSSLLPYNFGVQSE